MYITGSSSINSVLGISFSRDYPAFYIVDTIYFPHPLARPVANKRFAKPP